MTERRSSTRYYRAPLFQSRGRQDQRLRSRRPGGDCGGGRTVGRAVDRWAGGLVIRIPAGFNEVKAYVKQQVLEHLKAGGLLQ